MKINKYIGVRDFYPEDMVVENYIFDAWRKVANSFGYKEIDTPIIEPLELFTAKSGEEITSQLYNFTDKGDRKITLRPETTPSVARLVVQKQKELKKPMKWFSVSQCFRYERPQKGRLRGFVQFNADCLGVETPIADAENIALASNILLELGLTKDDFFIRLSQRELINSIFKNIKIKNIQPVFKLIDKKAKISEKDFVLGLKDNGLNDSQIDKINLLFTVKSVEDLEKSGLDYDKDAFENVKQISDYLTDFGLKDLMVLDLSVIRGFDYYTGIVFELYDRTGEFRAVAGGGRYDDLVGVFNGERCPGIGFGMGDAVLALLLEKKGLLKKLELSTDYFIAIMGEENSSYAIEVANSLRKKGNSVEIEVANRNFKKQMNYANSINAKNLIVIGDEETKNKSYKIKDLKTGKEK
ncbi:histidine--tRNA ligase [Candidatus Woesearchaeota archaeon]|nr:MAG: histidine--tRNA ligase [Candidatus Woesearchaeota archaeon]